MSHDGFVLELGQGTKCFEGCKVEQTSEGCKVEQTSEGCKVEQTSNYKFIRLSSFVTHS